METAKLAASETDVSFSGVGYLHAAGETNYLLASRLLYDVSLKYFALSSSGSLSLPTTIAAMKAIFPYAEDGHLDILEAVTQMFTKVSASNNAKKAWTAYGMFAHLVTDTFAHATIVTPYTVKGAGPTSIFSSSHFWASTDCSGKNNSPHFSEIELMKIAKHPGRFKDAGGKLCWDCFSKMVKLGVLRYSFIKYFTVPTAGTGVYEDNQAFVARRYSMASKSLKLHTAYLNDRKIFNSFFFVPCAENLTSDNPANTDANFRTKLRTLYEFGVEEQEKTQTHINWLYNIIWASTYKKDENNNKAQYFSTFECNCNLSFGNLPTYFTLPDLSHYYVQSENYCTIASESVTLPGSDIKFPNNCNYTMLTDPPSYFTVYYNANGGSGTMATTTVNYGDATTLRNNTFSNTANPYFVGWHAKREIKNCDDTHYEWYYTNGTTSKWIKEGESVDPGYAKYVYGNSANVSMTSPMFAGKVYMVAQWAPNKFFHISYKPEGASGAMASTTVYYGVATPLRENIFVNAAPNTIFAGWYAYRTSDAMWYCTNGSSTGWYSTVPSGYVKYLYPDEANVSQTSSVHDDTVNMYAKWTDRTFTIKYSGNGNTGGTMADTKVYYGIAIPLRSNAFTRTGFTFGGWNASRVKNGVTENFYKNASGTTVWATSQPAGYTLYVYANNQTLAQTHDVNGGVVTMKAIWK